MGTKRAITLLGKAPLWYTILLSELAVLGEQRKGVNKFWRIRYCQNAGSYIAWGVSRPQKRKKTLEGKGG